jgi:hypothetical protein
MWRSIRHTTLAALFGVALMASPHAAGIERRFVTLWTTGMNLMPGVRGLYPANKMNGSPSIAQVAAMVPYPPSWPRVLTWVASIPRVGAYHLWVRYYSGGYGPTLQIHEPGASVDEQSVTGGTRGETPCTNAPSCPRFIWVEKGVAHLTAAQHHVDVTFSGGAVDAVLLTNDPRFDPVTQLDPIDRPPIPQPLLRAPRTYRSDSALVMGKSGYFIGNVPPYSLALDDALPRPLRTNDSKVPYLDLRGAVNQYVGRIFAVRARTAASIFMVSMSELRSAAGDVIGHGEIDLKVVKLMRRVISAMNGELRASNQLHPELLVRDDSTDIDPVTGVSGDQGGYGPLPPRPKIYPVPPPRHGEPRPSPPDVAPSCRSSLSPNQSRELYLTVHVPETARPGRYTGTLTFQVVGDRARTETRRVVLDVDPIWLKNVEGVYDVFHTFTHAQGDTRYRAELADLARHGFTGTTLYGGYGDLVYAREAGMRGTVIDMTRPWPPPMDPTRPVLYAALTKHVADAKASGFADYLYFTKDEPGCIGSPQPCDERTVWSNVLVEARNRATLGLPAMITVNRPQVWPGKPGTWPQFDEVVPFPVFSLVADNGTQDVQPWYVTSSLGKGKQPLAYFSTAHSDPLIYRALSGLYARRAGYWGVMPYAYDYVQSTNATLPHERMSIWDPRNGGALVLAYPDRRGNPISTLRWEAMRDGIDDVRYLQALARAIDAAKSAAPLPGTPLAGALAEAQAVWQKEYGSIQGRYIEYIHGIAVQTLDGSRAAIARAIIALGAASNLDSPRGARAP